MLTFTALDAPDEPNGAAMLLRWSRRKIIPWCERWRKSWATPCPMKRWPILITPPRHYPNPPAPGERIIVPAHRGRDRQALRPQLTKLPQGQRPRHPHQASPTADHPALRQDEET